MTTKWLKILIVVMVAFLIFLLGYYRGQGEETTKVGFPAAGAVDVFSGEVETGVVTDADERAIYTWEDTENELIEKVNSLVGNESISRAIVQECVKQTEDYKLCMKNIIGIANAESGIFKQGMEPSKNGLGWMYRGKKRKFSSVEESIKLRVEMYVRNGREKRTTGDSRISGKYCTSQCTHWVKNYNSAIKKLSLD